MNLLSNSIKHTDHGHIQLTTWITPHPSHSTLEICVQDTGCGISEVLHPYLFEPLVFQERLSSEVTGWGLGLLICLDIVSLLGGQIWVDATPEIGACVHLQFPIFHSHLGNGVPMSCFDPTPLLSEYQGIAILLCDDDPLNRDYASLLLKNDFDLEIVASGEAALKAIQSRSFDLILMDIRMPGLTGIDAMSCIRRLPHWTPCPIVALTAQAMTGDHDRCLSYGFDDYLSKPATLQDILKCFSRLSLKKSG